MTHAERHARESAAVAGAAYGTSREMVRRAAVVRRVYGEEIFAALNAGELNLHRLYAEARGDERVGLFIKIPPVLRDAIRRTAQIDGRTVGELLTELLTQIFGEATGARHAGKVPGEPVEWG